MGIKQDGAPASFQRLQAVRKHLCSRPLSEALLTLCLTSGISDIDIYP